MAGVLTKFAVRGLHGRRDIEVTITDNTLVLVGENGSGKTTLLRMMFYFISGRWSSLIQFQFQSLSAEVSSEEFSVTREDLLKEFGRTESRFLSLYPPSLRDRVRDLIATGDVSRIPMEVERLTARYGFASRTLTREILDYIGDGPATAAAGEKTIRVVMARIQAAVGAQVLYLPTYRRIERELGSIFEGADPDDLRRYRQRHPEGGQSYIELVEFGMKDVQEAVDRTLESIRNYARETQNSLFLGYLSDVVNATYRDVDVSSVSEIPQETVRSVVFRIDDTILSQATKEHLLETITTLGSNENVTEHERIIYQYFRKILDFSNSLQVKELSISKFCSLCSEYIFDKDFIYNSSTFEFSIVPRDGQTGVPVDLADLSSGEKQIVSLFSHLYLSGTDKFFVLIDEPELSLSVPWQRRFLTDIRRGNFCTGVIAVTHSPFIYDNDLKPYAHSLNEFVAS